MMDRMGIFSTLIFAFVFHVQVEGGVADLCDIAPLNEKTQYIIDRMTSADLAVQNPDSLIVTVQDGKLSQMLAALCDYTDVKAKMIEIQNLIAGCPALLFRGDSKLSLIQIQGVALAQLFAVFTGVDNFCNCQSHLPMAWGLKESALTHTDNTAVFKTIADAAQICSDVTKTAITTIASLETTNQCKNPITSQAGFETTEKRERLASLKEFVDNNCATFDAGKWSCVTQQDSMGDMSNCMTSWAWQQPQNIIDCAKHICVTTFIAGPCNTTSELYIAAVKLENTSALVDMATPCSGLDIACVTYSGVMSINAAVQSIFAGIAQYVNMSTGIPIIRDTDIPTIFTKLCTDTGLKAAMTSIQTAATNCRYTTLLASQLGSLTIKDVAFAQFFVMFPNVDTFCQCRNALPAAWALQGDTTDRTYTDNDAAFRNIADVSKICGFPWKDVAVADVCKAAAREQAGYTDDTVAEFDQMYAIAEQCGTNTNTDWSCMKGVAKNNAFITCMSTEGSKVGDSARCGRYDCVETHMKTCTADARKLYIKAVNAENTNAIKTDRTGCDEAAMVEISLLVLFACFVLSRL